MSLRAFTLSLIGLKLFAIESWYLVQGDYSELGTAVIPTVIVMSIFFLFPFGVSMYLSWKLKTNTSQVILLFSSFLYLAWFIYAANDAYVHPDTQSGFVSLVVGIYLLPVMLPLWMAAGHFGRDSTADSEENG